MSKHIDPTRNAVVANLTASADALLAAGELGGTCSPTEIVEHLQDLCIEVGVLLHEIEGRLGAGGVCELIALACQTPSLCLECPNTNRDPAECGGCAQAFDIERFFRDDLLDRRVIDDPDACVGFEEKYGEFFAGVEEGVCERLGYSPQRYMRFDRMERLFL